MLSEVLPTDIQHTTEELSISRLIWCFSMNALWFQISKWIQIQISAHSRSHSDGWHFSEFWPHVFSFYNLVRLSVQSCTIVQARRSLVHVVLILRPCQPKFRYHMVGKNCHFCTTRTFRHVDLKKWFQLCDAKVPKKHTFCSFLLKVRKFRFGTAQRPFVESTNRYGRLACDSNIFDASDMRCWPHAKILTRKNIAFEFRAPKSSKFSSLAPFSGLKPIWTKLH